MKKIFTVMFTLFVSIGVQANTSEFFKSLPFNDAIKTVRGDGSRKLAVFSDPTCPYSQQFEANLQGINNVTVYTFVTPLRGQESVVLAQSIVCSSNPSSAWKNWMIGDVKPSGGSCNALSLTRNLPLYKRVGGRGTPFVILEDGKDFAGAAPTAEIEKMLRFAKGTSVGASKKQQSNAYKEEISTTIGMFR